MFNKTYHQNVPYTKNVTSIVGITENKAPTDESIRLLNEFEEKVKKNILHKVNIKSNTLSGASVSVQNSPFGDSITNLVRFNLNGKDYYFEHDIDKFELIRTDGTSATINMIVEIYRKIVEEIIEKLFVDNVSEILRYVGVK